MERESKKKYMNKTIHQAVMPCFLELHEYELIYVSGDDRFSSTSETLVVTSSMFIVMIVCGHFQIVSYY
jgi:hypothetical protein